MQVTWIKDNIEELPSQVHKSYYQTIESVVSKVQKISRDIDNKLSSALHSRNLSAYDQLPDILSKFDKL